MTEMMDEPDQRTASDMLQHVLVANGVSNASFMNSSFNSVNHIAIGPCTSSVVRTQIGWLAS